MVNLNLIVIKTDKLQEQSEFYSDLGFQFDYHRHGNGPYHYASIGGNAVLEIYPLPKGVITPDHTTRLGFIVENLNLTIQHLTHKGIKIISEPAQTEWGYTAIVQDFDGRKIELTEEKNK
ncbi:VOC family protein [Chitinophaga sp. RCC_12]|uniref:VOC family protein n=1 Tax=Chitinophaga sp. RCC_12 TaxID=3239226 RepID=UPI0035244AD8